MSHDPQSPSDRADHEDDVRLRERDYDLGAKAFYAGKPFLAGANIDWQCGWSDAQSDEELDQ